MGADPMAVVDDHLNAPPIMIGEKATRMMLASTVQAVAA